MWIALGTAAAVLAAFVFLAYRRGWAWTGFRGKSLWDWLSLLVVPAGLALALFLLDDAQSRRERDRAEASAQRAAAVELDRRRAALLSEYLQRMSDLMLSHGLTRAKANTAVAQLASTLTLTVLGQLDGRRKAQVLLFIDRSRLIDPKISRLDLVGADFRGIDAHGISFPRAMGLRGVYFDGANFDGVRIGSSPLPVGSRFSARGVPSGIYGTFTGATFRGANLEVEFGPSDLRDADFSGAFLNGSALEGCLTRTRFRGASLFDVTLFGARGDRTDFRGATLRGTSLRPSFGAVLTHARFDGARLGDFHVPPSWTRAGERAVRCPG